MNLVGKRFGTQGHSVDYPQLLKDLGYTVVQLELSDEDMEELVC